MRRHLQFAVALLLDVVGAGGALLVSIQTWQVLTTRLPQRVDVVQLNGRDVDPASTALALVALAGVVAVLATRGVWRRVVGALVALSGVGLIWRGATAGAVSGDRARSLVESRHPTVSLPSDVAPRVEVHSVWPVLSVIGGVLVLVAGLLVAIRSGRWRTMSSRYQATPDPEAEDARAAATMWSALDRGDDPTSEPVSDPTSDASRRKPADPT